MDISELKLITAANIINLRSQAGLTQTELGAALSYSDKTVSKWERGEAVPDALVLTEMAELFHVTVDYILTSHDHWENPEEVRRRNQPMFTANIVIAITVLGIFTAALTAFVICWILGILEWRIFLIALVGSALVTLILDCIFKNGRYLRLTLPTLIISIFVSVYFAFQEHNPWQIFLVMIPSLVIAILATYLSKKKK